MTLETGVKALAEAVAVDVKALEDGKVDKVAGYSLVADDEIDKLSTVEQDAQKNTVSSVAGKRGDVLIDREDVGLGAVDNTSDTDKPVSTAVAAALASKQDSASLGSAAFADVSSFATAAQGLLAENAQPKEAGKGLSEQNYTLAEKQKLAGVAAEATKNRSDADTDSLLAGKVSNDDARLTNAREWIADTVPQAEAEDGAATTRRAWTAQRVRQAFVSYFGAISSTLGRTLIGRATAALMRADLGLGTAALKNVGTAAGEVMEVGAGGWLGQGNYTPTAWGYPKSIDDATNITRVSRSDVLDNGVASYAASFHFAVVNTWGRLRVGYQSPSAWIQGGYAPGGEGWTSQIVLSGNLLTTTGQSTQFPMSQKATTDAIANISSLGVGQTWRDVKASRETGTTYTNTTDKPIAVSIAVRPNITSSLYVDDVLVATASPIDKYYSDQSSLFTVVPAGSTYKFTGHQKGDIIWAELR